MKIRLKISAYREISPEQGCVPNPFAPFARARPREERDWFAMIWSNISDAACPTARFPNYIA